MLYLIIYARDCKPDSKLQPNFQIPSLCLLRCKSWFFGLWFWPQFVSQTGLKQAGGIYNEARLTTGLTIYGFLGAAEKTLFFFLPTKPRPESAPKAVWPQFLPQTNTEHAETVDEKSPKSKCLGAETVWKHAKRTRGQTHVSWGGRGRWFKSCHSDQVNGGCRSSVYLYFTRVFRTFGCGIFLYRASKKCSENSEKSSLYIIWYIGSNGAFHRSVEANA